jgi:hypothetical protein
VNQRNRAWPAIALYRKQSQKAYGNARFLTQEINMHSDELELVSGQDINTLRAALDVLRMLRTRTVDIDNPIADHCEAAIDTIIEIIDTVLARMACPDAGF